MADEPVNPNTTNINTIMVWAVLGGGLLLLLSWIFRFPWG